MRNIQDNWIEEYLSYEAKERHKRNIHAIATIIYPSAWGESGSIGLESNSALSWATKAYSKIITGETK